MHMPMHTRGTVSGNACISGRTSCDGACLYRETMQVSQINLAMRQNQRSEKEQVAML